MPYQIGRVSIRRLWRLMTQGLRGAHDSRTKRLFICQIFSFGVFLYVWFQFSAVAWPKFFGKIDPKLRQTPDVNLLDYFLSAQHDGASISWVHGVNSRKALIDALRSNVMVIEADVILLGQYTTEQQLVPVMAHPPVVTSDISLAEWLNLIKFHSKAFKLDFKSSESVEISLQKLKESQEDFHIPIHLSAAVLNGANAHLSAEKTVDALQFIRLCSKSFPQSTIALGWVTERSQLEGGEGERYNWTDVKMMNDLLERSPVNQPLTFNVRASFARKSTSQLKWLLEMTRATLTVISPLNDNVPVADLLYVRHKFPKHSVFYDLPSVLQADFDNARKREGAIPKDVAEDEMLAFNADKWKVVRSQEGETIYLGTQSVLLQTGLLLTKSEYVASRTTPVRIQGRVEFLNYEHRADEDLSGAPVGLAVFLRVTQSSRPDSISGIRCFMGVKGILKVETRGVPGADSELKTVIPGSAPCFLFKIADYGDDKIVLSVKRPKSCENMDVIDFENDITFKMTGITTSSWYIAIKQSVPIGFTAIDQFTIFTVNS